MLPEAPILDLDHFPVILAKTTDAGRDCMQNETPPLGHAAETLQAFEPETVIIPAGEFLMGGAPEAVPLFEDADMQNTYARGWPRSQHVLYLPDYYIARTPITNAQYAAFLQDTDHPRPMRWRSNKPPKGKEQYPVVYISWHDAIAYCRWLAEATNKPYRLPSEAQWEKAASWEDRTMMTDRAGTDSGLLPTVGGLQGRQRRYPWGDEWDTVCCNTVESGLNAVTPVAAYPQGASPYGLLDMAGNVWEWMLSLWGSDWYKPFFGYPYDASDGREDLTADDSVCRVLRGGSFAYLGEFSQCVFRYKNYPVNSSDGIGFRVVLPAGAFI
jgi:formylglycine-generating enzyme required for sulfatase activity